MANFFRKGFLLGLGAAVSGKEKLENGLKELVDEGELSRDEARSVMDDFVDKGETKTDEWNAKQREQTDKMIKSLGIATNEDVDALRLRVKDLEEKLEK